MYVHNKAKTFLHLCYLTRFIKITDPFSKARLDKCINIQASNCDFKNFLVTFWSGIFPFFVVVAGLFCPFPQFLCGFMVKFHFFYLYS